MEERLIECASAVLAGRLVELARLAEQIQDGRDRGAARVEIRAVGLLKLCLQACALVADVAHSFGYLLPWPVGVSHQVEEPVFVLVEFGQLLGDPFA
ncbi:hypothetical protein [Acrocarpospora catenulata]|uniref:hypothetical protein n=1 Tax=Acrocarpospora catenulata TaxID=2836182 RepID=UPI001BDAC4D5|nr:hypothetical protein [Acrocarpospora catenulata]